MMATVRMGGEHSEYIEVGLVVSPKSYYYSEPTRIPPSMTSISADLQNTILRGSQLEVLMTNDEALQIIKDISFWLQHISKSLQPERLNPVQLKLVNCIQQLAELALQQTPGAR